MKKLILFLILIPKLLIAENINSIGLQGGLFQVSNTYSYTRIPNFSCYYTHEFKDFKFLVGANKWLNYQTYNPVTFSNSELFNVIEVKQSKISNYIFNKSIDAKINPRIVTSATASLQIGISKYFWNKNKNKWDLGFGYFAAKQTVRLSNINILYYDAEQYGQDFHLFDMGTLLFINYTKKIYKNISAIANLNHRYYLQWQKHQIECNIGLQYGFNKIQKS